MIEDEMEESTYTPTGYVYVANSRSKKVEMMSARCKEERIGNSTSLRT